MKRTGVILVLLPLIATTAAADVKVDWDHAFDFTHRWTFGREEGTPLSNPLAAQRIDQALEALLIEKGLEKTEPPGLLVVVHASVEPGRILNVDRYGPAGPGWATDLHAIQSIEAGTLVVDVLDPSTRRLVWRGVSTRVVTNNPGRNQKPIPKTLRRMLRKFPPPAEKPSR